ncbi:MAG: S1/P1 nuclease [Pedobacter sp.]|nr:S1/P1 nuclease [Pedobacter sp.]MDQ8051609.1 S1/P1 nuclease [Pedobacter sp.]
MKLKHIFSPTLFILSILFISWGYTGHRTIGLIAESQLSPSAKNAIKQLLGDTSLADACTWADDARREPQFRETANWHFLNLPLGLNFEGLKKFIDTTGKENIYSAYFQAQKTLIDPKSTKQQQVYALKFVLHFVGDIHQPMHISRAEDKGGNTIQLNYDGKGTNLHSLWDTKMLEKAGLDYTQLAAKYSQVAPSQIKQWQKDDVIQWIWESYQISSTLYAEVDTMKKRSIGDDYYQSHLPIVERRLQQAGIRLAGILNKIYTGKSRK